MADKQLVNDMTTGPILKKLFLFALPVMLANLLQAVYSMVDMIVVGNVVGSVGLSAVGIGGQIQMMFLSIGMGYSYGGQVLISQQVGAKDERISPTIGTLFTTEAVLSVVFGIVGILVCSPLLGLMNTPEGAFADARSYTIICCCGMPFIFGYNAVCSLLRGMGESKLPLVFIAIASLVNVVLDLLLVAGFHMRAAGAALATVIAQAVAFVASLAYLIRHREAFHFDFRWRSFAIDRARLAALSKVGVPYIAQCLLITCSMMYVNARINAYGVTASAVDSVGNKLNNIVNIIVGAISVSSATVMAQNFGARKLERIKQTYRACFFICMAWWVILTAVYLLFPRQIFRIFSDDLEVLDLAPVYLKIAVVWVLSISTMTAPYAVIDGLGYASFGLVISIMDGVVARIGLCLLLGHIMGRNGFWLGNGLAGFVSTIMAGAYYYSGRWKTRKLLLERPDEDV